MAEKSPPQIRCPIHLLADGQSVASVDVLWRLLDPDATAGAALFAPHFLDPLTGQWRSASIHKLGPESFKARSNPRFRDGRVYSGTEFDAFFDRLFPPSTASRPGLSSHAMGALAGQSPWDLRLGGPDGPPEGGHGAKATLCHDDLEEIGSRYWIKAMPAAALAPSMAREEAAQIQRAVEAAAPKPATAPGARL